MKKNNIYKLLVTSLSLATMSACTDLVNDEKDSIVRTSVGGAFVAGDPAALLESAYKDLGAYTDQANIYALGQHTSAEMIPPTRGVDWGDNGVWRTLDAHTWDATHSGVTNAWNQLNQRVFKATEIIASNPTPSQKAQAQFLRAFNMFHVMDYWGQVPFREVTQGVDELPKTLSRSEAFDFIVKDLEEALPNLVKAGPSATNGVANKSAANFLLAKLFLNKAVYKGTTPAGPYTFDKADMDKVTKYVDAITADGYTLEKDYFTAFTAAAKNETIFVSLEGTGQNRWMMTLHYNQNPSGWNGFTTLADFYDKFEKDDPRIGKAAKGDGKEFSGIGRGFLIGKQIDDAGKDLIDTRTQKVLSFTRDVPLAGAGTDKGIRVIKYHPADASKYILMRYAEALLMKAEAQFRGGDTAGALATVNSLRTTRGGKALASLSADSMFDEIGRETYWEGGKRTVEVRYGKFTTGTGVEIKDAYTVLFPIPSSAIVSNPNLKQNTGY
ncbi:MAG: RagB/SusD family nutrient uptake outer membrane protein [Emticicia sp.]